MAHGFPRPEVGKVLLDALGCEVVGIAIVGQLLRSRFELATDQGEECDGERARALKSISAGKQCERTVGFGQDGDG